MGGCEKASVREWMCEKQVGRGVCETERARCVRDRVGEVCERQRDREGEVCVRQRDREGEE